MIDVLRKYLMDGFFGGGVGDVPTPPRSKIFAPFS